MVQIIVDTVKKPVQQSTVSQPVSKPPFVKKPDGSVVVVSPIAQKVSPVEEPEEPEKEKRPPPGVSVSQTPEGQIVTRVTLPPGASSDLRWEQGQPMTQGDVITTPYTLKGRITGPRKTEGIKPQEKLLTPGEKLSYEMTKPGHRFWYGQQTTPEQVAHGPDLKYETRPSSRAVLAETFTNIGVGLTGGSAWRLTKGATGFMRYVYGGAKIVAGGSAAVHTGKDIVETTLAVQNKTINNAMLGYKAFQYGAGIAGFTYGVRGRGFGNQLQIIKTPRRFKEPESMFENRYIRNVTGYKTRPTTQLQLGATSNRYLMVSKKQLIPLEASRWQTPKIRTTATLGTTEPTGLKVITPKIKTTQLSVYGAKVYDKPMSLPSYSSKVPWRFESITKQTRLQPTNTWTNIRFEKGRMITEQIPLEKVRFWGDTRAAQTLLLLRDKPQKQLFSSEIYTKMESSYTKPSFRLGLLQLPWEKPGYLGRYETPLSSSSDISLDTVIYGELQQQKQAPLLEQSLRQDTKQQEKQLSRLSSVQLQGQQQRQKSEQTSQSVTEQVIRTQQRITNSVTLATSSLYRPSDDSSELILSGKTRLPGYDVYIKDRTYVKGRKALPERWKKANTQPISEHAAMSLGATAVDQSAAASFKIRPTTGHAQPLKTPVNPWDTLSGKFYQKKGTYIEHTQHRIDSPGEIQGISALGWIAKQNRLYRDIQRPQQAIKNVRTVEPRTMQMNYKLPSFNHIMRGVGL